MIKLKQFALALASMLPLTASGARDLSKRSGLTQPELYRSAQMACSMMAIYEIARGDFLKAGLHCAYAEGFNDREPPPDPSTMN